MSTIKERIASADSTILSHFDQESDVLKAAYLSALEVNYNEENDGSTSLADYVDDQADSYLELALSIYIERLVTQLTNITRDELEAVSADERGQLTQPYFDYFKKKSGLGTFEPEPW